MRQMVRGGKAPAEFVNGTRRRNTRTPSHSESEGQRPMPHVDLRVIRKVNLSNDAPKIEEWRDFIDEFACQNRALGTGRTLGSVAMTYIPATHMNVMLAERFPKAYGNRKGKLDVFRKINANLKAFIEEQGKKFGEAKIAEVQSLHDDRMYEWRADHVIDLFDAEGKPTKVTPPESVTSLSPEEKLHLQTYRFGPAVLAVRGLALCEGNHYGADLSADEIAHHERQDITDYLRYEERLDTSILNPGWKPHATLFDVLPHLKVPDNLPLREDAPLKLSFMPPTTETYGLDGSVLSR
jgi:hypothetical protein